MFLEQNNFFDSWNIILMIVHSFNFVDIFTFTFDATLVIVVLFQNLLIIW